MVQEEIKEIIDTHLANEYGVDWNVEGLINDISTIFPLPPEINTDTIPEMKHDNFDEIVLHIGGDPNDPEDLGADMTFGVGGDHMKFDKSYGVYIPKGVKHGPLIWHNFRKPHIEMAMMLGAGTLKEGWGFDLADMQMRRAESKKE